MIEKEIHLGSCGHLQLCNFSSREPHKFSDPNFAAPVHSTIYRPRGAILKVVMQSAYIAQSGGSFDEISTDAAI